MARFDYEEYQQQVADQVDEDLAADPDVPPHVRTQLRQQLAERRSRRATMGGGREYRQVQPWIPATRPRPSPDVELLQRRLRLLELGAR